MKDEKNISSNGEKRIKKNGMGIVLNGMRTIKKNDKLQWLLGKQITERRHLLVGKDGVMNIRSIEQMSKEFAYSNTRRWLSRLSVAVVLVVEKNGLDFLPLNILRKMGESIVEQSVVIFTRISSKTDFPKRTFQSYA